MTDEETTSYYEEEEEEEEEEEYNMSLGYENDNDRVAKILVELDALEKLELEFNKRRTNLKLLIDAGNSRKRLNARMVDDDPRNLKSVKCI